MKIFEMGDLVRVTTSFMGEPQGVLAVVYDLYPGGVLIITENGADLGVFNEEEQEMYLELEKNTSFNYSFKNVMQLSRDFDDGVFNKVFKK